MLRKRNALTIVEVIVVILIIGTLLALGMPTGGGSREPERRATCLQNLNRIAEAILRYEQDHGTLPPAFTVDAAGNRLHSWRTLILPYLDEPALYASIDLTKPWDDPANAQARQATVSVYECPSSPPDDIGFTSYLALLGRGGAFTGSTPRSLDDFGGKAGATLAVVDAGYEHLVHWMSPLDFETEKVLSINMSLFGNHPDILAASLDGQTVAIARDTEPAKFRAMLTNSEDEEPTP